MNRPELSEDLKKRLAAYISPNNQQHRINPFAMPTSQSNQALNNAEVVPHAVSIAPRSHRRPSARPVIPLRGMSNSIASGEQSTYLTPEVASPVIEPRSQNSLNVSLANVDPSNAVTLPRRPSKDTIPTNPISNANTSSPFTTQSIKPLKIFNYPSSSLNSLESNSLHSSSNINNHGSTTNDVSNKKVQELQASLAETRNQASADKAKTRDFETKLIVQQAQLQQSRRIVEQHENERATHALELEKLLKQISIHELSHAQHQQQQQRTHKLEEEASQWKGKHERLVMKLKTAEGDKSLEILKYSAQEKEKVHLQEETESLRSHLRSSEEKLSSAERENVSMKQHLISIENEKHSLTQTLRQIETERDSVHETLRTVELRHQSTLQHLEQENQSFKEQAVDAEKTLQNTHEHHAFKLQELATSNSEKEACVAGIKEELEATKAKLEGAKPREQTLLFDNNQLNIKLQQLTQHSHIIEQDLDRARQEIKQMQDRIDKLLKQQQQQNELKHQHRHEQFLQLQKQQQQQSQFQSIESEIIEELQVQQQQLLAAMELKMQAMEERFTKELADAHNHLSSLEAQLVESDDTLRGVLTKNLELVSRVASHDEHVHLLSLEKKKSNQSVDQSTLHSSPNTVTNQGRSDALEFLQQQLRDLTARIHKRDQLIQLYEKDNAELIAGFVAQEAKIREYEGWQRETDLHFSIN